MLKSLSIKNLALIKSEEIEFHDGLNILLGETGSGKSLIFDAIMFVTNQKSDKTLLRNGEQSMKVDALFSSLSDATVDVLKSYDLDTDELLISRTLQSDGKTNFRVNGEIVTGAMVKTLAKTLLDFMVQHESVEILKTKNHLLMLDKFGGKEIEDLKSELAKLFQIYLKVSGVSLFFMAAFAAVSSIVSFKARNNDSKKLFILNIVFGVISGVEVNLVGGILALIALKKQSNEENIEQKEETIAIE